MPIQRSKTSLDKLVLGGHVSFRQADSARRFYRDMIVGCGCTIRSCLAKLEPVSGAAGADGGSTARRSAYRSYVDACQVLDGTMLPAVVPLAPSNVLMAFVADNAALPAIAALLGVARETARSRIVASLAKLTAHYSKQPAASISTSITA
jgi:hypothetical protein